MLPSPSAPSIPKPVQVPKIINKNASFKRR